MKQCSVISPKDIPVDSYDHRHNTTVKSFYWSTAATEHSELDCVTWCQSICFRTCWMVPNDRRASNAPFFTSIKMIHSLSNCSSFDLHKRIRVACYIKQSFLSLLPIAWLYIVAVFWSLREDPNRTSFIWNGIPIRSDSDFIIWDNLRFQFGTYQCHHINRLITLQSI